MKLFVVVVKDDDLPEYEPEICSLDGKKKYSTVDESEADLFVSKFSLEFPWCKYTKVSFEV